MKNILKVVLKKSSEGWDYVTEGLIKLAFILLDCSGAESNIGLFLLGTIGQTLLNTYHKRSVCQVAYITLFFHNNSMLITQTN